MKTMIVRFLSVAALLSTSAFAQEVSLPQEFGEKIKAAQSVSPLGTDAFGNSTNEATGQTVFSTIDIDLPGNNALPVRFGRRLEIGPRYVNEELGGLGNWDIDVPYIESTFSKTYGWSVAVSNSPNRYKRCSIGGAPQVEGALFSSEEVSHGYRVHIPGVLDDQMMANANNHPNPTDGNVYRWVVGTQARVSCLSSIKNGQPGEGFIVHLPDGVKYHFDFPVERNAATLRKGPKFLAGYTMPRKRIFMLATRIEDRFGNYVNLQYTTNGQLTSVVANDDRQISIQSSGSGYIATANGRQWQYVIQNGHLVNVVNPDSSKWTYSPYGIYAARVDHPDDTLPLDYFTPEAFCQANQDYPDYMGTSGFSVTHPSGARAEFDFAGHVFARSRVPYICIIDFFDHQARVFNFLSRDSGASQQIRDFARCFMSATSDAQRSECGGVPLEYTPVSDGFELEDVSGYARIQTPNAFPVMSLVKTELFGSGLSSHVTQYSYQHQNFAYCDLYDHQTGQPYGPRCTEDPCADGSCTDSVGRWTEITKPNGDKVRKRYGVMYGINEGMLLEEQVVNAQGQLMRHVLHHYIDGADNTTQPFNRRVGFAYTPDPMLGRLMPHKSTEIRESGESFISEVSSYDTFGRPVQVLKTNSMGHLNHRFDVVEYHDNFNLWVIGQSRKQYTIESGPNGRDHFGGALVSSEVEYDNRALPWKVYKFGRLDSTITYHADGTVATVADGKGNVAAFTDWKRGIPRHVRHPVTAEAAGGATEHATVDDNGWITSLTDEVGAVTGYGYDLMGRLASIVYPTGDTLAAPSANGGYYNTIRNFRPLVAADWKPAGVVDGQWRLYEETDKRVSITYMDALWRPLLKHEYDAQNVSATLRSAKTVYDASGRVSFQSYPSSQNIPGDTGVRTFYDALDRVTRVEQDSEHDVLVTTTEYLSYLRTRVTNPRGAATTTSFMAWDQPTYDYPITSIQPEGKVISINRHPQFGWPLSLTQRNSTSTLSATRRYVYDGHAQLCKTIEPETGVTVMGYDGAGNPSWQAAGLDANSGSYNSLTDCQHAAANGSGRVVTRTYDPRNRLTHLTFPNGGMGNQIWTYEKDNLPSSVTAYNNVNSAFPVVTTYTYNKRRLLTGETLAQPGWYSWSVGYAYDGYGHLSMQTYPTGLAIDYAPNPLGQPTKAGTYASGAQYYPNGALKQFTYGNGVVHVMQQNARQLPSRVVNSANPINFAQNNTNAVLDNAYQYDRNGNVTNIWDYGRGDGYQYSRWLEYDQLDRLTAAGSVSFGGDHWHRMTYDELDNLKSWKLAGVKDYAEYVYDTRNRLTSIRNTAGATVVGIGYDLQGNLQNKNGQIYTFDFGNRLRNVTDKEAYRYDGLGRRVTTWKLNNAAELWMYSQAGQMLFSSDWEGSGYLNHKTHEHVYLAGSLIASIDHAWPSNAVLATKYQHTDALGSPVAVTDASGQVIERMDYEPWGAIIGKPNHNGIGYTGHVMDGATGLTYMQQRYYDQSVGRFLSVDPVTANAGTGVNFNRYWYANNNPYKFVDPDGRQSQQAESVKNYIVNTYRAIKSDFVEVFSAATDPAMDGTLPPGPTLRLFLALSPFVELRAGTGAATARPAGPLGIPTRASFRSPAAEPLPPPRYGPFHRLESPTQSPTVASLIEQSGELMGTGMRQVGGGRSPNPVAQAYVGPLPEGARGVEFFTPVAPTSGSRPGAADWYRGTDGVRDVDDDWVSVPVEVTKNTQK
jgi:RHS repeat-associated protein